MNTRLVSFFLAIFCTNVFAQTEPNTTPVWDDSVFMKEIDEKVQALSQERLSSLTPEALEQAREKINKLLLEIEQVKNWQQIRNSELPKVVAALGLFDVIWAQQLNNAILNGGAKKPSVQITRLQNDESKLDKIVKEAKEWIEKIPSLKRYTETKEVKEFKLKVRESAEFKNAVLVTSDPADATHALFETRAELIYLKMVFSQWLQVSPIGR